MATTPYAAPQTKLEHPLQGQHWRKRKNLVMLKLAAFPNRCIYCNAPANPAQKKFRVCWHHPSWFLRSLESALTNPTLTGFTQECVEIQPALCEMHWNAYKTKRLISWASLGVGIASFIGGLSNVEIGLVALGTFITVGAGIAILITRSPLVASHMNPTFIHLRGCGQDFLDSLPEFSDH
jgi:hypothetical protein